MSDLSSGYLFVPSEGRDSLSSVKLNAQLNGAKINPSFVSSKPPVSSVTSADQLLVLKADGTLARVPATAVGSGGGGGGDMYKSTYDTNANNVVDTCDSLAWAKLTGVPSTFPPDSSAMLKSTYDANNDGIVDQAAVVPWTGITGKPSSFTPASHAPTPLDNGTDPLPVATTLRTGSLRILSGTAGQYLDGTGNWSTPTGTGPTVDSGTWTTLSAASGWSAGSITPQYRVETIGSVKSVYCRGIMQALYTALGTTAFTLPSAAFPSAIRSMTLSGAQNTGTAGDVTAYIATITTSGVVTIYFLGGSAFVYADKSQTNLVYLDGLIFSL